MKVVRLMVGLALGSALVTACGKTEGGPGGAADAGAGGLADEKPVASAGGPSDDGMDSLAGQWHSEAGATAGGAAGEGGARESAAAAAGAAGEAGAPPAAPTAR